MDYRFATPGDAALLAQMNRQLIEDEGHRNAMELLELEERMRTWLEGEYQAVIFTRTGSAVGYALYRHETEHVYLRQFFVSRDWRRQGLGRRAVKWLIEHPWRDAQRLRLDVLIGNDQGVAFWKSVGFQAYCLTMECETYS